MQSSHDRSDDDEKSNLKKSTKETGAAVIPDGVDINWTSNVIFDANNQIIGNDIGIERLHEKIKNEKKNKPSSTTLNKFILRRIYNAMQSEYNTTFLRVQTDQSTGKTIYTKLQLNDVTSLLSQLDTSTTGSRPTPVQVSQRPMSAYNLFFLVEQKRILKELENIQDPTVLFNQLPPKPGARTNITNEDDIRRVLNHTNERTTKKGEPTKLTQTQSNSNKIPFQQLVMLIAKRWRLECSEEERQVFHNYSKREMDRYKVQHQKQEQI